MQKFSLAFSSCPNDTFIFHALIHKLIQYDDIVFNTTLADVETLNQEARKQTFEITKLSFAALAHLQESYGLLRSGAALGRGCGPLLIAKPGYTLDQISKSKIAVPGLWTTANMLLGLYLEQKPDIISMPFDKIMPCVQNEEINFGVIIHEGRFTFQEYGLICLADLGEWWEKKSSLPIPLGGIAIKRNIDKKTAQKVDKLIKQSAQFAFNNKSISEEYIKQHAQELDIDVIQQHINLYVNDFSIELGKQGILAIETLLKIAREKKIIPQSNTPIFAY